MLDRASTFAQPEIVKLLKSQFVPVAIDQAYQRRQQDAEGEFYRQIAGQGPRSNFNSTTQGFYIATASGKLLLYNNNRDPDKVLRLMNEKLAEFNEQGYATAEVAAIQGGNADEKYNPQPPDGGLIVRVHAKVLDGYPETLDRWERIFQTSISRDNLWISQAEHQALVRNEVPQSLARRIARFHLVDNTRGEPPMWGEKEIRQIELTLNQGKLRGNVHLETKDGSRGYIAQVYGDLDVSQGQITRFDVVAHGDYWGAGEFTSNPPPGKFPLAVAFSLADGSDPADKIPPQASRGWIRGYIE